MPQRTVSLDNSPNERVFTVVAVIDNVHQKEAREREIREALQCMPGSHLVTTNETKKIGYVWKTGVVLGILGVIGGIIYILINYPP